jgi:hypothetical protein
MDLNEFVGELNTYGQTLSLKEKDRYFSQILEADSTAKRFIGW